MAPWFLLAVVVVTTAVLRMRLLGVPLERDEGEFAYGGQLILDGVAPYRHLYAMKLPGIYAAYAALMALFGQTPTGIHRGLLLVNAATIVLIFLLARRILAPTAAVIAATSYAVLSISPSIYGQAAHATHFVVLFSVAGIVIMLRALDKDSVRLLFVSGVLLGVAVLMKQPGATFVLFAACCVIAHEMGLWPALRRRAALRAGIVIAGSVLPLVVAWLLLAYQGLLQQSIFWNFRYAAEYERERPLSGAFPSLAHAFQDVAGPDLALWMLGGIGLLLTLARKKTPTSWFLIGYAVSAVPAVAAGFYFRPHYFVALFPALALLAAAPFQVLFRSDSSTARAHATTFTRRRRVAVSFGAAVAFIGITGYCLLGMRPFLFERSPIANARALYALNPFPEAVPIADYIQRNTQPSDTVAVLGSEPEIFFLAHRQSATGHIYMYPLLEKQKYAMSMQRQMIAEIERAKPRFIVVVHLAAPPEVLRWFHTYRADYRLVGVADTISDHETVYRWGSDAATYQPVSSWVVGVFERID